MIHDSLSRETLERYGVMHPRFPEAFDYLLRHFSDFADPAMDGRHELDGDNLFVIVGDHPLKEAKEAKLEAHDRYIDIQLVISGKEDFGWRDRGKCENPQGEMDAERDLLFYDDLPSSIVTALEGEFVVFFPEDAHAPLIRPADQEKGAVSRKAIVKVKVK